jgi:hypothetical protein
MTPWSQYPNLGDMITEPTQLVVQLNAPLGIERVWSAPLLRCCRECSVCGIKANAPAPPRQDLLVRTGPLSRADMAAVTRSSSEAMIRECGGLVSRQSPLISVEATSIAAIGHVVRVFFFSQLYGVSPTLWRPSTLPIRSQLQSSVLL